MATPCPVTVAAKAHLAARDALEHANVNNLHPDDPRFAAVLSTVEALRKAVAASEDN